MPRGTIYRRFVGSLDTRAAMLERLVYSGEMSSELLLGFINRLPAEYWAIETRAVAAWFRDDLRRGAPLKLSLN